MIDIIVPTFNRHTSINRLIEDLTNQDDQDFKLNIIDQSATPFKNNKDTKFKVISHWIPKIRSPIIARDYGIKNTSSEILLFLDDDIVPAPNLISNLKSIYKELNIPLVIGGITNVRIQNKFERFIRKIFQHGIYDDPRYAYFKKAYDKNYHEIPSFLFTPYVSASILAVNREALEINPLPTQFKQHILGGDIYYGMECRKKGIRVCISYLLSAREISDENFEYKSIKGYKKIFLSFHSALLVLKMNGINFKNIFHFFLRTILICFFLIRLVIKNCI